MKYSTKYNRKWRKENPEKVRIISDRFRKNNPANIILNGIKQRCNNPNCHAYYRYGERGIKNYLTIKDIKLLMKRDNYDKLKRPSIDRIDNDGHYEYNNCRFIELTQNIKRANDRNIKKYGKPVIQFDKDGNYINKFRSIGQASKETGIDSSKISRAARGLKYFKTAGGFIWELEKGINHE